MRSVTTALVYFRRERSGVASISLLSVAGETFAFLGVLNADVTLALRREDASRLWRIARPGFGFTEAPVLALARDALWAT